MPDPVTRRINARAILYVEQTGDGLEVTRVVVDCPVPDGACIIANLPSPFDAEGGTEPWPWSPADEAVAARALETFPSTTPPGGHVPEVG